MTELEKRQKIILDNLPLAKIIASKMYYKLCGNVEYDDLYQEAVIGLIDAVDKYKSTNNVKFTTYASYRIRGQIIDLARKKDYYNRKMRNEVKKGIRKNITFVQYESCRNIGVPFKNIEEKIDLNNIINNLSKIEMQIIYYRYVNGLSLTSISNKTNKRCSYICKIHKKALDKIKNKL